MSSSKHINAICIAAIVLSLLLTVLFMNGTSLGIQSTPNDVDDGGYFTTNDRLADSNAAWS